MHSLSASSLFAIAVALSPAACADAVDPLLATTDAPASQNGANSSVDDDRCSGIVAGGTYETIKVEEGSTCTLRGVIVRGNVVALKNARLFIEDSRVDGNIQGENAAVVHVRGGRLGGSLQIQEGISTGELGVSITGGTVLTQGSIQITKMRTGQIVVSDAILEKGNLQIEENAVSTGLETTRNRVAQNLEVRKNLGGAAKVVRDNTVGQKLECKENESPFVGGPNVASEAEGQCF
jgi:hypothetical protein